MVLQPESRVVIEWLRKRLYRQIQSKRILRNFKVKHKNSRKNSLMSVIGSIDKIFNLRKSKTKKGRSLMKFKFSIKMRKLIWKRSLMNKIKFLMSFKQKLFHYWNNKTLGWRKWASWTKRDLISMKELINWTKRSKKSKNETRHKNSTIKRRRRN